MKILVTGGCGFIGSNFIINQINNKKNQVLNYDILTYAANLENLKSFEKNNLYQFVKGDIQDIKLLTECINSFKPNVIINFAAESHVDRSIDGPKDFINTNIIGTYTLLHASLKYYNSLNAKLKSKFKFLHISTDEVYGSLSHEGFFKETTAYAPSSPYSASKAASDHLVKAWYHTYKLPILITNCSNNYGPFQFPEKLIPLMIISCIEKKKLPIYGDGKNIRDWIHVSDHCDAINNVIDSGVVGETYNVGGNQEKTNLEIVITICDLLNQKIPLDNNEKYQDSIVFVKDRPGHDFRYAIDSSKIKSHLGWEPKFDFNKGINKTIDWYLNNRLWWKKIINKKYNLTRLGEG